MPDWYLSRASAAPPPAPPAPAATGGPAAAAAPAPAPAPPAPPPALEAPNPLFSVVLTVAVPVIVVIIGRALITTVALDSTSYAVSYSGIRAATAQVLEKDLAADRIQEVLNDLPDPMPGVDEKAQTARKTDRAARLKSVAARLNGERVRLVDKLMKLVLATHPALPAPKDEAQPLAHLRQAVGSAASPAERRQRIASFVAALLDPAKVQGQTELWVSESLDDRGRAALANTVTAPKPEDAGAVAAKAVGASLSVGALQRATEAVIALPFNPFETRPGESAWASDAAARLGWALVALFFTLTFGIVVLASLSQIWRINPFARTVLIVVTIVVARAAGAVSRDAFSPANGLTPLHVSLATYAQLFKVGILAWSDQFNVLRGVGVTMLVAGALATFWLKASTAGELNEQLRGFKALFNAGAVFLMAGTFEVYAAFRWPVVFAADDATRSALQAAASAFALTVGAGFSVVMLATYFVTTFVLRQQAVAHAILPEEVETAFQTFGFSDLTSQQFLRFAQSLLPLLPGAVTLFLS